jgi:hypothetical protein
VPRLSIDLTGKVFGRWTVLARSGVEKGRPYWSSRCECGVEKRILGANLRYGISTSCGGCWNGDDLSGRRFGRLLVRDRAQRAGWSCVCDCGSVRDFTASHLVSRQNNSCGCLINETRDRVEQEKKRRSLVTMRRKSVASLRKCTACRSWDEMIKRCGKPEHGDYANYGARGIKVCERWTDFENFLADMGHRPAGTSLDRIDNNGNYEPGNCRWATPTQQNRNSRHCKLTFDLVQEIMGRLEHGESPTSVARRFKITPPTVLGIRDGRSWRDVPGFRGAPTAF